ncbi:predicted protein [Sclerotinia sclerotiorum 1980 UF-70]|uniref:Uncharacterized protein n=1 Tax=Sclerotinia sclerotiorum (strain ATCC 18683 / 1980 / Ss-1) TaxID=665079 RepID=A7E7M3_SCLS1|nr:predicted protein [Sclerotinia sclerotiorum 1980 UF-70]EDN96375.1 predicted protein [Sclerotinia sclerotiorum 1980 UF-70]
MVLAVMDPQLCHPARNVTYITQVYWLIRLQYWTIRVASATKWS